MVRKERFLYIFNFVHILLDVPDVKHKQTILDQATS